MSVHVALIRALNVGGTGKLSMEDLKTVAGDIGLKELSTYIQSGNLIFRDEGEPDEIAAMLDTALGLKLGKAPGVMLRSPAELRGVLEDNPFSGMDPSRVLVSFFSHRLPDYALNGIIAPDGEEAVAAQREIYVHYPLGSGRSRFKLPFLARGTSRNINTVTKLAELGERLESRFSRP